MVAVVKVAGFQYRIEPDQILRVPKIEGDEGSTVTLADVLLILDGKGTTVGRPTIAGASVSAKVLQQSRTPKLVAGKYKRRRKYRRKWGHRQDFTEIQIAGIRAAGTKE